MGRFLEPDPIGFIGGMNFYAYVGNNPVNWVDPWGLDVWVENTTAVNGWHRRIRVMTPNGPYGQSFGMRSRALPQQGSSKAKSGHPGRGNSGSGVVYSDNIDVATKEVVRFPTSPEEDLLIEKMLKEEVGNTGPFHWLANNCRGYSMRKFKEIKKFIEERRKKCKKMQSY